MRTSLHDHVEDKTPEEIRESAYRRGFQQGMDAALRLSRGETSLATLTEWELVVADWRFRLGPFKAERSIVQYPPRVVDGKIRANYAKRKPEHELRPDREP